MADCVHHCLKNPLLLRRALNLVILFEVISCLQFAWQNYFKIYFEQKLLEYAIS